MKLTCVLEQNILIKNMPPSEWWIKLCDFGISKSTEEEDLTESTVKGTIAYMPPERFGFVESATKDSPMDQAGDMWALGEILVRMLTGEPTFRNLPAMVRYIGDPKLLPRDRLSNRGVGITGIDFIAETLKVAPDRRLTVLGGFKHRWINDYKDSPAVLAAAASPK
jgi:serine/threonine protein kinase